MLGKILESLYLKVFINIIVKRSSTTVHVEVHSKSKELSHYESVFESNHLTDEIYEFIIGFTKESPYYYIAFLDLSDTQGVLPSCDKTKLNFYKDLSTSEYKCIDKSWITYTSKTQLYTLEKQYEDIGIDFVFSPFVLLSNFFKEKTEKSIAMYALICDNAISVMVFENSILLFGEHLKMDANVEAETMVLEEDIDEKEIDLDFEDDGIVLDDMDIDDDLEDFSDIEDLDTLEDIEEFSEGKDLEEELLENEELEHHSQSPQETDNANFNEDYEKFSIIQRAINHFYKDERYDSQFLENIYIADSTHVSGDLKHYLEEEMFLNVYIRNIDLGVEICELAKAELRS